MKRWILRALVLLFLLTFTGGGSSSAAIVRPQQPQLQSEAADQEALNGSCGVERWSVKTGTDADTHTDEHANIYTHQEAELLLPCPDKWNGPSGSSAGMCEESSGQVCSAKPIVPLRHKAATFP